MYKILFLLVTLMVSCGPPEAQRDGDRNVNYRDVRDRSGDTSHLEGDVEDITDDPENFLDRIQQSIEKVWDNAQECESSTPNIPLSELDFIFTVVGRKALLLLEESASFKDLKRLHLDFVTGKDQFTTLTKPMVGDMMKEVSEFPELMKIF